VTHSDCGEADPVALRDLFALSSRRQRFLDVEAALASAQAEVGMIPAPAAEAIAGAARIEMLDERVMDAEQRRTGHSMVPVIAELSRAVGPEWGGYVRWVRRHRTFSKPGTS
jgi:3-carboxy-cis,cis-muconate cycloisomerase